MIFKPVDMHSLVAVVSVVYSSCYGCQALTVCELNVEIVNWCLQSCKVVIFDPDFLTSNTHTQTHRHLPAPVSK